MVHALVIAIVTTLVFSGLIAFRYLWTGTRTASMIALVIAAEAVILAIVFVFLTTQWFVNVPWLDVDLQRGATDAVAFVITAAGFGLVFLLMRRTREGEHQVTRPVLFGLLIPLVVGLLIVGIRVDQTSDNGSVETATPPVALPLEPASQAYHLNSFGRPFMRPPYLGKCSTDSVTVAWQTDIPSSSLVKYGTTPLLGSERSDANTDIEHVITLEGLESGTSYYYQAFSKGQPLAPIATFRTAKGPDQPKLAFAVLGDSGQGSLPQFAIAAGVHAAQPDFVLHTGDVIYPQGQTWNWDPFYFVPYRQILASTCLYTARGNHDELDPYRAAMVLPNNNGSLARWSELFYSFDYGRAHFISLDTNIASQPDQLAWLRQDLQLASRNPNISWIFVFLHHAPFASGHLTHIALHGGGTRDYFVPLFEEFGVDVVFSGHEHAYERTCPMLAGACAVPESDGILYIVTGGGGHYELMANVCGAGCPWSQFHAAIFHFVKVTVEGDTLTGQAIDLNGVVIDTFTVQK